MNDDFLLTIAIPVYNREKIVRQTLDSVAAQTFRPLKVILVDNNSTDRTFEVLQSWKKDNESADFQIQVLQESKPGASAARNCALRNVETEWTMFFDSDDLMLPRHVEYAVEALQKSPGCNVVGWEQAFIYNDKIISVPFSSAKESLWFYTIVYDIFQTQRYMAKTELFKTAGGWNDELMVSEDMELGLRLIRQNLNMTKYTGDSQVHTILSEDSLTRGKKSVTMQYSINSWRKIMPLIPSNMKKWADFHRIYQWAAIGKVNLKELDLSKDDWAKGNFLWRLLLKAVYHYTVNGGRGAMRVFLLLANKTKKPVFV